MVPIASANSVAVRATYGFSDQRDKSHASSINSPGQVADASYTRNGNRRGRVDGHQISGRVGPAQPPTNLRLTKWALVTVLTPICVEFTANGDQENLAALRKITSNWQQGQYLKGGWATRPGATSSNFHELAGSLGRNPVEHKRHPNELCRAPRHRPYRQNGVGRSYRSACVA